MFFKKRNKIREQELKISQLEMSLDFQKNTCSYQAEKLSEKETDLKNLQQKLSYSEGQVQALQVLVTTLRDQLKEQAERCSKLDAALLLSYQVSRDSIVQDLKSLYEEDENTVEQLHNEYKEMQGEL